MANIVSDDSKIMKMGFEAMNKNLTDCAKSLRIISSGLMSEKMEKWFPAIGDDAVFPDHKMYDWVLVKIRGLKDPSKTVYGCPHVAMYHHETWWPNEWSGCYGSDEVPFEVVAWRPIPGDNIVDIRNDFGEVVRRDHLYE